LSRLSVIGTFYKRPEHLPRIAEALRSQTRKPDNLWLMYEEAPDGEALEAIDDWGIHPLDVQIVPMAWATHPDRNPLAVAINIALDIDFRSDYFVYLTDDSLPAPDKYARMAATLDENPDYGSVYCSQDFGKLPTSAEWLDAPWGGHSVRHATEPTDTPFGRVDHTQVMHRRCLARWPTARSDMRLSDACFFQDLVIETGPMMPVPEVLDWTRQLPTGISG